MLTFLPQEAGIWATAKEGGSSNTNCCLTQQYCSQNFLSFPGNDFLNPITYEQPLFLRKVQAIISINPQLLRNKYCLLDMLQARHCAESHIFSTLILTTTLQKNYQLHFPDVQRESQKGFPLCHNSSLTTILVTRLNCVSFWLYLRQIAFHFTFWAMNL